MVRDVDRDGVKGSSLGLEIGKGLRIWDLVQH